MTWTIESALLMDDPEPGCQSAPGLFLLTYFATFQPQNSRGIDHVVVG